MMDLYFISNNEFKIKEVQDFFKGSGITIIPQKIKIEEIQSQDVNKLVRDKALKAFYKLGRPLFVDHTSLYLAALNSFPGGLTQIFWDNLGTDGFAALVGKLDNRKAIAKTTIGYCDGKKIYTFEGKTEGIVTDVPRGDRSFQWDCIFIPDGSSSTFAELQEDKAVNSMRSYALNLLKKHLSC